jgi:hypothetical protein
MFESYEVLKPLTIVGWFIIDTLYGMKDRQTDLRASMIRSMDRVAELLEATPREQSTSEGGAARSAT